MVPREIRVVLVDDHHLVRQALARLLDTVDGLRVVGEAADGPTAVERVLELDPEVVIVDVAMVGTDGIETAHLVRQAHPRTEVVALAEYRSEAHQRQAFQAGVRGYIVKDCTLEVLVECIRRAAHGEYYLFGAAGEDMVAEYVRPLIRRQKPGGLVTPREREVACLLADGYSTKEAAAALSISVKTAETHRASIMRKLGARNLADIVKYCIRNHLIDL